MPWVTGSAIARCGVQWMGEISPGSATLSYWHCQRCGTPNPLQSNLTHCLACGALATQWEQESASDPLRDRAVPTQPAALDGASMATVRFSLRNAAGIT